LELESEGSAARNRMTGGFSDALEKNGNFRIDLKIAENMLAIIGDVAPNTCC
jgi:hypothetical protein